MAEACIFIFGILFAILFLMVSVLSLALIAANEEIFPLTKYCLGGFKNARIPGKVILILLNFILGVMELPVTIIILICMFFAVFFDYIMDKNKSFKECLEETYGVCHYNDGSYTLLGFYIEPKKKKETE